MTIATELLLYRTGDSGDDMATVTARRRYVAWTRVAGFCNSDDESQVECCSHARRDTCRSERLSFVVMSCRYQSVSLSHGSRCTDESTAVDEWNTKVDIHQTLSSLLSWSPCRPSVQMNMFSPVVVLEGNNVVRQLSVLMRMEVLTINIISCNYNLKYYAKVYVKKNH